MLFITVRTKRSLRYASSVSGNKIRAYIKHRLRVSFHLLSLSLSLFFTTSILADTCLVARIRRTAPPNEVFHPLKILRARMRIQMSRSLASGNFGSCTVIINWREIGAQTSRPVS